ncbi:TetR/AcrR family transcriptional regulator [Streptomyces sp. M19]
MEKEPPQQSRRVPAGAAVLREDVTAAIHAAVLEELTSVGYGRMSIERVARRAGVGKAAVYRRWSSKLPIVLDLVSAMATQGLPAPDTGTLDGDVRVLLKATARALQHPMAARILPDLLAESARNPEIAEALHRRCAPPSARSPRPSSATRSAAPNCPPTPMSTSPSTWPAALYWRLAMVRSPLPDGYLDALTAATAAALGAARLG